MRNSGDGNFSSRSNKKIQKSDFPSSEIDETLPEVTLGDVENRSIKHRGVDSRIPVSGLMETSGNDGRSDIHRASYDNDLGRLEKPNLKLESLVKQLGTKLKGIEGFEVWKKAIKDTTYDAPLEEEKPTGFLSTTLDKVVFGCCVSVIALALIALAFNAYKKRQSAAAADASAPRSAARPSSYRVLV